MSVQTLVVSPDQLEIVISGHDTLLELVRHTGLSIPSVCGGRGICKSCVVRYVEGEVPQAAEQDIQFFSASKLARGWRRACLSSPEKSCRVEIPARARARAARLADGGRDFWIEPKTQVRRYGLSVPRPSLEDTRSDGDRVADEALRRHGIRIDTFDHLAVSELRVTLETSAWAVDALVRGTELIGLLPGNQRMLGLAVDLGTTNIGIALVDLENGKTLGITGVENPQREYGADIVSRVERAADSPEVARRMKVAVANAINVATIELCDRAALSAAGIVDVVIAGNTVMQHLLWGYPVRQLSEAPFVPAVTRPSEFRARELGIGCAPGARVYGLTNISGFVGGDHTAVLTAIGAERERRTVLVLDIGTNTEVSLIHNGSILSVSCPSGPALEAGNISCGMRAADGAIESIRVADSNISVKTIGGTEAVGICGSAVLDVVGQFYRAGVINARGRIDGASEFCHEVDHSRSLLVCRSSHGDIYFSQQDVRNVQLAKAAVRAGIELLLSEASVTAADLERVVVAGSFGLYLDTQSLLDIGMLPDLSAGIVEQIGNASMIGAKLALVSSDLRSTSEGLATQARYLEQAGSPTFMKRFMAQLNLPPIAP